MTSATPSHPARPNLPLLIAAVAAVVVLAVIVAALYAFFFGGGAAAFGHWMYASALGVFVRYVLEGLLLLVCILISTAVLI